MKSFNFYDDDEDSDYGDNIDYNNIIPPTRNEFALSMFLFETQFTETVEINKIVVYFYKISNIYFILGLSLFFVYVRFFFSCLVKKFFLFRSDLS